MRSIHVYNIGHHHRDDDVAAGSGGLGIGVMAMSKVMMLTSILIFNYS